jgi:hypothetical protein
MKREVFMTSAFTQRQVKWPGALTFGLVVVALTLTGGHPAAQSRTYTTDADFNLGTLNSVNHDAPNSNQLQLSETSSTEPFLYVAETHEGILIKFDTNTGRQVGRYETTRIVDCPQCPPSRQFTWYPSRTAVDLNGDVWVANRSFAYFGAITKIANNKADCIDRNGNSQIETSNDADADGFVNIADPAEFFGQNDECVLKSIPVAGQDHLLRALAIEGDGDVWVGTYNSPNAYEIDPLTNVIKRVISLSSPAYGFVIRGNYLYHASLGNVVERVDISLGANLSGPPGRVLLPPVPNYGIAVDSNGVAWFGDYFSGLRRCVFDAPALCTAIAGGGSHYGVTVDGDDQIWAGNPSGVVDKFSNAGVFLGSAPAGSVQPYGVAVGHDGNIWTAGWNGLARVGAGPVGGAPGAATSYSTARFSGGPTPFTYTYSDFTGFQARNFTVKQGTWTVVHDGGAAGTPWGKVTWNQETQGSSPAGTLILAEVRAADTMAGLAALPFTAVSNGTGFGGVSGQFIEVKMTLRITDVASNVSPVLSDVTIDPSNQPPVALCQAVTVNTAPGTCSASASINNGSSDPDGDPLTTSFVPPGPYGLGTTSVVMTVTDPLGASASCTANVTVIDNQAPSVVSVTPSAASLWTPNHKMVPITIAATATDNCGGPLPASACVITGVSSNEPIDGLGSGDTAPDWNITGPMSVDLRSERQGGGSGRIYTVAVTCTDAAGNTSQGTTTVTVTHDQ